MLAAEDQGGNRNLAQRGLLVGTALERATLRDEDLGSEVERHVQNAIQHLDTAGAGREVARLHLFAHHLFQAPGLHAHDVGLAGRGNLGRLGQAICIHQTQPRHAIGRAPHDFHRDDPPHGQARQCEAMRCSVEYLRSQSADGRGACNRRHHDGPVAAERQDLRTEQAGVAHHSRQQNERLRHSRSLLRQGRPLRWRRQAQHPERSLRSTHAAHLRRLCVYLVRRMQWRTR